MKNSGFYIAMIVVQFAYGGSNFLIKIALERGLNQFVFVVYRHIIAMLLLGPLAYVLERKERPLLSVSVFGKIFLLSSLGTTIHLNVYYAGLAYTSPTVATALSNVIPSLTFLMAVFFRMEKVKIKSVSGGAKVLGSLICIGGSLIFTFWRGGFQLKGFVNRPLVNIYSTNGSHGECRYGKESWIKGSALILVSYIAWSGWLILQATVSKVYPAQLSLNVLICFIASLQSSVLALFFARNPLLWKLEWNVQLLTIIYCGVVLSALAYYLQTWCISNKGPVFAAMFTPLLGVIVAIFSAIVFAERLHLGSSMLFITTSSLLVKTNLQLKMEEVYYSWLLGSVIAFHNIFSLVGAFLIILGLYFVLWGKRRDSFVSGNTQDEDEKKLVIPTNKCPIATDKYVTREAIYRDI